MERNIFGADVAEVGHAGVFMNVNRATVEQILTKRCEVIALEAHDQGAIDGMRFRQSDRAYTCKGARTSDRFPSPKPIRVPTPLPLDVPSSASLPSAR